MCYITLWKSNYVINYKYSWRLSHKSQNKIAGVGTCLVVHWLGHCTPTTGSVGSVPGGGSKITRAAWCSQNTGGKSGAHMSQSSFSRRRKDKADTIRGKKVAAETAFAVKISERLDSASTFAGGWRGRPLPCACPPAACILHTRAHPGQRGMPTLTSTGVPSGANSSFPGQKQKKNCTYLTLKVESNHILQTLKSKQYLTTVFLKHFP